MSRDVDTVGRTVVSRAELITVLHRLLLGGEAAA